MFKYPILFILIFILSCTPRHPKQTSQSSANDIPNATNETLELAPEKKAKESLASADSQSQQEGSASSGNVVNPDTVLKAIAEENWYVVEVLLKEGANPVLPDGDTILMKYILSGGSLYTILKVPSIKPTINTRNKKQGETALFLAVKKRRFEAIKDLLEAEADPNIPDNKGTTAVSMIFEEALSQKKNLQDNFSKKQSGEITSGGLVLSLKFGSDSAYALNDLLKAGASPVLPDGDTVLMKHISEGFSVTDLLEFPSVKTMIEFRNKKTGETAFSLAVKNKNWFAIDALVSHGVKDTKALCSTENMPERIPDSWFFSFSRSKSLYLMVDLRQSYHTVLMICSLSGHAEGVKKLLQDSTVKSSINVSNDRGETALFLAASQGNAGIVSLLLEAGADPTIPDKEGETPLQVCGKPRRSGNAEWRFRYLRYVNRLTKYERTVKELLEHPSVRKNLNEKEIERLPLDVVVKKLAALNDRAAIQKVLDTPVGRERLKFKPKQKTVKEIEKLLQEKEIERKRRRGALISEKTLFLSVVETGSLSAVELLLEAGADPSVPDSYGNTPLMVAAEGGAKAVVERLLQIPSVKSAVNSKNTAKNFYYGGLYFDGKTAFFQTVKSLSDNKMEILDILLEAGADPTISDIDGYSPLMAVIRSFQGISKKVKEEKMALFKWLLSLPKVRDSAHLNTANGEGETALSLTERIIREQKSQPEDPEDPWLFEVRELLLEAGALPSQQESKKATKKKSLHAKEKDTGSNTTKESQKPNDLLRGTAQAEKKKTSLPEDSFWERILSGLKKLL